MGVTQKISIWVFFPFAIPIVLIGCIIIGWPRILIRAIGVIELILLFASILGVIALIKIIKNPLLRGAGIAITGIILNLLLILLIYFITPTF
ncbi:MAG: hypothetical protein KJ955_06965 [Nanoarchaeota archaeon]|nr:hypothetical protein [Nanoarchaeota archaeon]